jgi:hypothetical protein
MMHNVQIPASQGEVPPIRSRRRALMLLLALPSVASGAMIAGVEAPGTPPTPPPAGPAIHRTTSAVFINFDDTQQGCGFVSPLTISYSGLGVTFEGPAAGDGGAVLNECGGFSVSGYSSPNFLAFNSLHGLFPAGGVPKAPETLHFSPPVSQVSMLVAYGDNEGAEGAVTLRAYDASNALVSSQSMVPQPIAQLMSVGGPGIVRLIIDGPPIFIIDDLAFDYGVVRTASSSWGRVKTMYR